MIALLLCILAFTVVFWAGLRSLATGLIALFAVGYSYGILRANLPTTFSHFIFDAGLAGLYLSQRWSRENPVHAKSTRDLRSWVVTLIGWPVVLSFLPFQNLMVTLVGLRGNIFFLPCLILGSRLKSRDMSLLSGGLAVLNVMTLAIAGMEYVLGLERFFPHNAVTELIYRSQDVAGASFRIPSVFTGAHAYSGTMVMTLPILFDSWMQSRQTRRRRLLLVGGLLAALIGVLLAAARVHFVVAVLLVIVATFSMRLGGAKRLLWTAALVAIGVITIGNPRLQRFTTLTDSQMVADRLAGSVHRGLWEIATEYPLGNGLGGGGTSMPYFLQDQVSSPIYMENEYARIAAEQGVVGLLLWVGFMLWFLTRVPRIRKTALQGGRRLAYVACLCYFGLAMLGTGLLTSIPQTVLLLLCIGWISAEPSVELPEKTQVRWRAVYPVRTRPVQV